MSEVKVYRENKSRLNEVLSRSLNFLATPFLLTTVNKSPKPQKLSKEPRQPRISTSELKARLPILIKGANRFIIRCGRVYMQRQSEE